MSIVTLRRAEIQLQAHRAWLRTYVTVPSRSFEPHRPSPPKDLRHASLQPRNSLYAGKHAPITCAHASTYAKNPGRKAKLQKAKIESERDSIEKSIQVREDVQKLVQSDHISNVIAFYHTLPDKSLLNGSHVTTIVQCLQRHHRREKYVPQAQRNRDLLEDMVAFGQTLAEDIMKGKLPPNSQAHVLLLAFFNASGRRDGGLKFWKWLEKMDEPATSIHVYGAAIELLAANGAPLPELENLYKTALVRFPGSFWAYHLSPNAIIPDRTQPITFEEGFPFGLLRAIITARLLRGDTLNAYKGLDVALRLLPDSLAARFFGVFIEERPIIESYTIFALACRGGIALSSGVYGQILAGLRRHIDPSSPNKHVAVLRGMLSASYLHVSAGGAMGRNSLTEIIIALTHIMRLRGVEDIPTKPRKQLVDAVLDLIRKTIEVFSRYGHQPGAAAFNSTITNIGGLGHSKQVIGVALADMKAMGISPTAVTYRSVVSAAGFLGDGKFLIKSWQELVHARTAANMAPDATDFHVLVKAGHQSGELPYVKQQFEGMKEYLPVESHESILERIQDDEEKPKTSSSGRHLDVQSLLEQLSRVRADLVVFDAAAQRGTHMQDLNNLLLPMTLLSPGRPVLPEEEMRKLYDELSIEQDAFATEEQSHSAARSLTNISFDVLRYENWKTINYLLEQAEIETEAYSALVDQCIAKQVPPPPRNLGAALLNADFSLSTGLSDLATDASAGGSGARDTTSSSMFTAEEIQKGKQHILRLRGRV